MAVIGWTIVGLVAGVVTTAMFREHDTGGVAGALCVGVAGAVAAGGALAAGGVTELAVFFDPGAWLIVLGVALLLLAGYNVLTHGRDARGRSKTLAPLLRTAGEREQFARRRVTAPCPPVRTTPPRSRRRPPAFQTASCRRSSSR